MRFSDPNYQTSTLIRLDQPPVEVLKELGNEIISTSHGLMSTSITFSPTDSLMNQYKIFFNIYYGEGFNYSYPMLYLEKNEPNGFFYPVKCFVFLMNNNNPIEFDANNEQEFRKTLNTIVETQEVQDILYLIYHQAQKKSQLGSGQNIRLQPLGSPPTI